MHLVPWFSARPVGNPIAYTTGLKTLYTWAIVGWGPAHPQAVLLRAALPHVPKVSYGISGRF